MWLEILQSDWDARFLAPCTSRAKACHQTLPLACSGMGLARETSGIVGNSGVGNAGNSGIIGNAGNSRIIGNTGNSGIIGNSGKSGIIKFNDSCILCSIGNGGIKCKILLLREA